MKWLNMFLCLYTICVVFCLVFYMVLLPTVAKSNKRHMKYVMMASTIPVLNFYTSYKILNGVLSSVFRLITGDRRGQ